MRVKNVLEKLDEFEHMLQEFNRASRNLAGSSDDDPPEVHSKTQERAHFAFDDVRLGLLRKYHILRPHIKPHSRLFPSELPDESDDVDVYEFFIERGVGDEEVLYADLSNIKKQLEKIDADATLET